MRGLQPGPNPLDLPPGDRIDLGSGGPEPADRREGSMWSGHRRRPPSMPAGGSARVSPRAGPIGSAPKRLRSGLPVRQLAQLGILLALLGASSGAEAEPWRFEREPPFAFLSLDAGKGTVLSLRCSREAGSGIQTYLGFPSVCERDRLTGRRGADEVTLSVQGGGRRLDLAFLNDTSTADLFIDTVPEALIDLLAAAPRVRVSVAGTDRALLETGATGFAGGFSRWRAFCRRAR